MKATGEQVYIRPVDTADAEALFAMNTRNREFWGEFEPDMERPEPTLERQLTQIRKQKEKALADQYYFFGIYLNETDELIGDVTISDINRGPFQSCYIGYSLDKAHNGKGYTTEAVRLAAQHAFEQLGLHRLNAGVMPHNIASRRVLEKVGFQCEGIARENLKIKGVWQDHCQYAMVRSDWDRLKSK